MEYNQGTFKIKIQYVILKTLLIDEITVSSTDNSDYNIIRRHPNQKRFKGKEK